MSAVGYDGLGEIDAARLVAIQQGQTPYLIVDVGSAERFVNVHIPTSVFMEPELAAVSVDQWVAASSVAVIVCDDGVGSAREVARQVCARGFQNVGWLKDGVDSWISERQLTVNGWMPIAHGLGTTLLKECDASIVSPLEVESLAKASKALIIDVRTPQEHARTAIPGARNIPVGELVAAASDLERAKVDRIVLHCAGRTRGAAAASLLQGLGLNNLAILDGGTAAWAKSGKPLVEGRAPSELQNSPGFKVGSDDAERRKRLQDIYTAKLESPQSLMSRLFARKSRPVYVIDVRQSAEYHAGHIPGSIWCPTGEVAPSIDDLVPVRNASVVMVSDRGARAIVADSYYRRTGGFENTVLDGGVKGWLSLKLPLERGPPPKRPTTLREREGARIRAEMERHRTVA